LRPAEPPRLEQPLELPLDRVRPAQPSTDRPASIATLLRGRALDSELGALLWLLLDGGVSLVVAGPGEGAESRALRTAVLEALLDLVPSTRRRLRLEGSTEDFTWLDDAESLGWVRTTPAGPTAVDAAAAVILAGELGPLPPADTTGDRARLLVRALGRGFGLAATMDAARLEDVLAGLRRRPIELTDDELTNLGIVVVLQADAAGAPPRIVAAHYLRPLARDVHGHPQRLPPAVLATWDAAADRFEHFAWGIAAELAGRVGRRTGDFELEQERRAAVLTGMAAEDPSDPEVDDRAAIRATLDRQRVAGVTDAGLHRH
jgi:hypothetical protein